MHVVWGLPDILHEASTAAALQQSAAAMLKESGGHGSELTHRIARAGNFGSHKQNCARDINRALQLPLETLQLRMCPSIRFCLQFLIYFDL